MAEVGLLERATSLPVFSLESISNLYFCTGILCNNKELLSLITKCVFKEDLNEKLAIKNGKDYKNVEAKANELFSKMPEIGRFKKVILELLWPVTYRIIRWKSIYAPTINDNFLQYFHWTNQGRIDNKKTAKYLVGNKMIPIKKRFMLACSLCLSKEMDELWNNMLNDDDEWKLEEEDVQKTHPLLLFWLSKSEDEYDVFGDAFHEALLCAVNIGSIEAIKYLFSITPDSAKNDNAVLCSDVLVAKLRTFPFLEEDISDIGYFIFSQMTESNQKTFFNNHLLVVLLFLLYYPGQNQFLKVLKDKLKDTSEKDIENVLLLIFYKLYSDLYKDYDYLQLFVSVWKMLEDPFKKFLRQSSNLEYCFCLLISNYFRNLLTKKPSKKAKKTISENLINFNLDKRKLLHFFIKNEIVTTESLKNNRSRVLELLQIRKSNKPAWRRLLKFVSDNGTKKKRK